MIRFRISANFESYIDFRTLMHHFFATAEGTQYKVLEKSQVKGEA